MSNLRCEVNYSTIILMEMSVFVLWNWIRIFWFLKSSIEWRRFYGIDVKRKGNVQICWFEVSFYHALHSQAKYSWKYEYVYKIFSLEWNFFEYKRVRCTLAGSYYTWWNLVKLGFSSPESASLYYTRRNFVNGLVQRCNMRSL